MPTNLELAFADRPEVFAAWVGLNGAIKEGMDLRRYELATLAAPEASLQLLLSRPWHGPPGLHEPVLEIARDHRTAGLDEVDMAVMDLAEMVVDDASSIGRPTCCRSANWVSRRRRSWK